MKDLLGSLWKELTQKPISLHPDIIQNHWKDLYRNVLLPAAELKQAIAYSPIEYTITEHKKLLRQAISQADKLLDYTLIDIVKWRDRDPSDARGGVYCCLFAGIYQAGMGQEEDLPLAKPMLLVFDKEVNWQVLEYSQTREDTCSEPRSSGDLSGNVKSPLTSTGQSDERSTPQTTVRPGRRENEDKSVRSTPSRESREKAKRGKGTEDRAC